MRRVGWHSLNYEAVNDHKEWKRSFRAFCIRRILDTNQADVLSVGFIFNHFLQDLQRIQTFILDN